MSFRVARLVTLVFPAAMLCGCGDGRLETAPVRGTITCGGQPVTSGSVSFNPIVEGGPATQARPAVGAVGADGSFVLTTYESDDGAVVGKHEVSYSPPPPPGEGIELGDEEGGAPVPATPPVSPKKGQKVPCRFGGTAEVEVADGENVLTIDLSELRPGEGASEE